MEHFLIEPSLWEEWAKEAHWSSRSAQDTIPVNPLPASYQRPYRIFTTLPPLPTSFGHRSDYSYPSIRLHSPLTPFVTTRKVKPAPVLVPRFQNKPRVVGFPDGGPQREQLLELPKWSARSEDPTTYSKGAPVAQPQWIAQAKDPTTYSEGASTTEPTRTVNQAALKHAVFPEYVPWLLQTSGPPERTTQAKDPTTYPKGMSIVQPTGNVHPAVPKQPYFSAHTPRLEQAPEPPEWITQAKDPTTYPKGASIDQAEWIPQAKDPTTYSKGGSVTELTGPNVKQAMPRNSWDNRNDPPTGPPSSLAVTHRVSTRSVMFRISTFWHRLFQRKEVQLNDGSPVARGISPASSTTLCPGFSVITAPSGHGHEIPPPVLSHPERELRSTPKISSERAKWIAQTKDPTAHSERTAMTGLADPTVKQMAAPFTETSLLSKEAFKATSTVPCASSGAMQDDFVRDLTGLVWRGPRTYPGRYSDVYRGICDQRLVAIKVIKKLPSDPLHAVRRRMRREVGTASRFNHPNVLAVYGVIEADWCEFGGIVTLWCSNGDACSYLRSNLLTPSARLLMVCGVVAGLEYIHNLSVVHGDLKPGNILIDASGNPLICDFGLVCILDAEQPDRVADNTSTVHTGTVRYLSYELAKDPPDPRTMSSDIHALGCVAYEFLYLERPYATRDGNNAELYIFRDIAAGISPAPRPPYSLSTSISDLWRLLERCWDKEPYQRPTISAFSHSLQPLTESVLLLDDHSY